MILRTICGRRGQVPSSQPLPASKRCAILSHCGKHKQLNFMAHYKLYCIGASGNSYKVALYLNCAGLDWEPVGIDFFKGATRDPKWRASFNEMGEAPVLES